MSRRERLQRELEGLLNSNFDSLTLTGKRARKQTVPFLKTISRQSVYDENGVHVHSGKDLCDCLDLDCQGCHYPCEKCHSSKCGTECRQNRDWQYDHVIKQHSDKPSHVIRANNVPTKD